MRRNVILFVLMLLVFMPAMAQKKEIAAARDQVKAGKDLAKAEQSMTTLLKDSANRENTKIWDVLFEALQKQYDQGNEKLYLRQKYDTASIFNIASRMFTAMEAFDSIDSRPDSKGRIKPERRKDNAARLNMLRPNLYNGGVYFLSKQDYNQAYLFFSQYINTANAPMFANYDYQMKDKNLPTAAYWAVFCGYKLKDASKVYNNTYLALKDTTHNESMMQFLAATYQLDGDTARYSKTLKDGFYRYPNSDFFFPHLIDYYSARRDWKEALDATDYAIKNDSTNKMAWLTKSTIFLNTADYEGCITISDSLVVRDSTLADAWLNSGLARFNQGVALDKNVQRLKKNRNLILQYYKEALPYLEHYRRLKPDAIDKWALPLYTIYLNLNMGTKFDEIDKILNK